MKMKSKKMMNGLLWKSFALLGFTACSDGPDDIPLEYGVPTANFQVKGSVTSTDGVPLKGIQVIFSDADTVYTDAAGKFGTKEISSFPDYNLKVSFNDVDGEENGGTFKSTSIALKEMEAKELEKGDGWYEGKIEFSTKGAVKLEKK